MVDLAAAIQHSAAGMRVQSERLRIISENIANAESMSLTPGGDPYRRKTIYFSNLLDKELGMKKVQVSRISTDPSDFKLVYDPSHPHASPDGYVKMPNVEPLIEMQDLKEAQRSYEANVSAIEISKNMIGRGMELLQR